MAQQAYISQLARKTGKAFQKGATCPHAEVGWPLLRILSNTMAESLISASGHVTEIAQQHHESQPLDVTSLRNLAKEPCEGTLPGSKAFSMWMLPMWPEYVVSVSSSQVYILSVVIRQPWSSTSTS